ncbi:hypothetical protein OUZ56_032097 [Daphnia magna]|uniref:Uncharacterized protein n=1 Tax=Daphnia magna TaxID=35525 RepID=A0ABQ9ZW46_9CRUS|nr:hypothetical protein OUZ56_032097 [Daphnia magna]
MQSGYSRLGLRTPTKSRKSNHQYGRLQTSLLPSTDDREDQNGVQAACIPDHDEEDIFYCADYSSDMEDILFVVAYHNDNEDILYGANNPYDYEVMYDADVSCYTDDISLHSVDDAGEEDSFFSDTSTLILDPATLLEDRASPYRLSPASDIQERGIDIAALKDSIVRLHGKKCNFSFVSSHYRGPGNSAVRRTHM